MNAGDFIAGTAVSVLALGPLVGGAVAARRRWLPSWNGVHARIAEYIAVIAGLTLAIEVPGAVGVLHAWIVVVVCVLLGAFAWLLAGRGEDAARQRSDGDGDPGDGKPFASLVDFAKPATVLASLAVVVISVQWIAGTVHNLRVGMQRSIDTLWYHAPMAANFVQDASITRIHYFDDNPVTAFFPAGSEVLHAAGIFFFGDDVLSPLLNLGFLALATMSAWSIGRSLGSAPASVLGVLVVLGTPVFVHQQPGGGYNDVVGMAFVLAALALLLRGGAKGPALVLAGVAGGLAVGTKFTMLAPVGTLMIGLLIVAGRGRRLTVFLTWTAAIAALGGVWFVRNLVVAGNPLPGLSLSIGPISLPPLRTSTPIDRVINYATNWNIIRQIIIPGWSSTMGPGWWATIAGGVLGGLLVAVRSRITLARVAGAVAVVSFVAFLVQPQYIGIEGLPVFFRTNTRYSFTALAVGMVVLPALPVLRTRRGARLLVASFSFLVVLTQVRLRQLWSTGARDIVTSVLIVGGGTGMLWGIARLRRRHRSRAFTAAALGAMVLAMVVVWFIQQDVRGLRYHDRDNSVAAVALLRDERDVRIAEIGLVLKYPLYGPDLSNHVAWIGKRGDNGNFTAFMTCRGWKRFLNRGDYDYVLLKGEVPGEGRPRRYFSWAGADDALSFVAGGGDASTFAVRGRLDPATCP